MAGHRTGGRGAWAAVLGVACAAGAASGQAVHVPGHYAGTWTNTTFSTMGAISADLDLLPDGSFVLDRITASGTVFGVGGVQPFPLLCAWNAGQHKWSVQFVSNPVLGDLTGQETQGGSVSLNGSNVPGAFVNAYSALGVHSGGTLDLSGTIALNPSGMASTVIHAARGAFSRVRSAGQTAGGRFGFAVAAAGPGQVGSGVRARFIVGAPMEHPAGVLRAGRAYVYDALTEMQVLALMSPGTIVDGMFGSAAASVPDVNGDGVSDWVVGAPGEHPGASPIGTGRAYIYSGLTGALLQRLLPPTPAAGLGFGSSVAGVPDVNGDGRGDVAVGAPFETIAGQGRVGRVHVYSGATGLRLRTIQLPASVANTYFGTAVSGLTDVNGDGRGDLLIGAPENSPANPPTGRPGHAYVFSGATGGLYRILNSPVNGANGYFGFSVSGVPDTNNDGRMDLVVGGPWEHPGASPVNCGRVHLYSGATGGLLFKLLPPTPVANGNYGFSVAGAPDMNGDGRGDVIVGAPGEPGAGGGGRVHLYSGATGARFASLGSLYPDISGHFGSAAAAIPDYTGNGRAEVLVGAPEENPSGTPANCGRAYIGRR